MHQFFAFVFVCAVELFLATQPTFIVRKELQATVYVVEYGIFDIVN